MAADGQHPRWGGGGNVGISSCRFDSLGLFAVKKVIGFERLLTVAVLEGGGENDLHEFQDAQGYPSSAYLGGHQAIIEALDDCGVVTHGGGAASSSWDDQTEVEQVLPFVKQKAIDPRVWDAPGRLRGHGAHMPLLFFVGDRSLRSEDALTAREAKQIARGWGPGSLKRSHFETHILPKQKGKGKKSKGNEGKGKGKK